MKYLLLLLLLVSANCWAGEYTFTYNMPDGRQLKVKREADTKWEALKNAGVFCGEFFGVKPGISEDRLAEILTTCANPSMD